MAVTKKQTKQATDKNGPAKKSGKKSGKQATSGNALVKKDSKKDVAKKGPGKLGSARSYLTGVLNELKKVHWPNRKETTIYTSVVFVAVVVVAGLIWIFDLLLSGLLVLIY
jgi:preprotein translocase subunit SecE